MSRRAFKNDVRKREVCLMWLQKCGIEIDELPPKAWKLMKDIDYNQLIRPMVIEDHKKKSLSRGQIAIKYGIDKRRIKYILTGN